MTSRQETRSSRRWILVALLVFLLCLVLWIAAALILNIAFAESLPFSLGLRSRLAANYAPDDFVGSLGIFRLSIIDEVLLDRGLSPEEAEEQSNKIREAMTSPVPTATALDFEGKEPYTATPTEPPRTTSTLSPTETPIPTLTPSAEKSPTKTAVTFMPSETPGPPMPCKVKPVVEIIQPRPSWVIYGIGDDILSEVNAYDPDNVDPDKCLPIGGPNGAGINKVEFKFYWVDGGDIIVHLQYQDSLRYCGFTGTSFCNTWPVANPYWPDGFTPISHGLHKMKVRAEDDEGIWSNWEWIYFYLDISTPTATPPPVDTPTYTPTLNNTSTPMYTSTSTPTYTPTSTPTPSSTPSPTSTDIPTSTLTASPTSTDTPMSCPDFVLSGFGDDEGNHIWWDLTNTSPISVTLIQVDMTWNTGDNLNKIDLGGSSIWNVGAPPPSVSINSGWTGVSRLIDPSNVKELRFEFANSVEGGTFNVIVHSDNGCAISDTQTESD